MLLQLAVPRATQRPSMLRNICLLRCQIQLQLLLQPHCMLIETGGTSSAASKAVGKFPRRTYRA